jgi:hypothetical protein
VRGKFYGTVICLSSKLKSPLAYNFNLIRMVLNIK